MEKAGRNVKVYAVNNGTDKGFSVYLDFSGQLEFLMTRRHNGLLFSVLKDGVAVDELRRWSLGKTRLSSRINPWSSSGTMELNKIVKHLLMVIDDYLNERAVA